ncbi:helix-turn-helix domain-containing protein [Saccharothrix australiensis]|uniref:helix-turn-helix domain-containing protein n=1 Tax=Saccharothrix australiensis TaxID=2072 RepID=UPI001B8729D2|nr:helix-turn-helix domain-containing protein [Saccharothrix australiensis]
MADGSAANHHAGEATTPPLDTPDAGRVRDTLLLHTPAQVARVLSVRESWLRRMAGRREIPCTFLGKHLRFSEADLRAIVRRGARPARGDASRADRPVTRPPGSRRR